MYFMFHKFLTFHNAYYLTQLPFMAFISGSIVQLSLWTKNMLTKKAKKKKEELDFLATISIRSIFLLHPSLKGKTSLQILSCYLQILSYIAENLKKLVPTWPKLPIFGGNINPKCFKRWKNQK